ncbi:hypothetical protein [Novilysobacter avium]|uniref:N-acetyltransferase domain-containing protein n=1 Tax=Novilysobacter avium TaxID=2781023 RepID=A0A7S6UJ92_9GAMM|nr:hypothetical protein [Lysobacter avium]QOW21265.1 hypothetical protein INQ42_08220 [Lysobacter avium]
MSALLQAAVPGAETPLYATQPGDVVRDREEVLGVWQDHFGPRGIQGAKFDHFYRENRYGPPILQLLRHLPTGALVGVIGAGPRPFLCRGRAIRAGVVAHFAVDEKHRSLGPALMLQESLIDAARGRFDLLYGLPRSNAVAVSKRAGFHVMGTLVRHARVLRHGEYLRRRMPAFLASSSGLLIDFGRRLRTGAADSLFSELQWEWVSASDERMDALWREALHTEALTSVRDHALLRWRFDTPPAGRAHYLLVSGKDGRLRAWFACEVSEGQGGPLTVMDYWSTDAMIGIGRPLIRALISAADQQGCSAVHLLLTASDPAMAGWRSEGFVPRSEQPLIGLWLTPQRMPEEDTQLHVTMLDQDG